MMVAICVVGVLLLVVVFGVFLLADIRSAW